MNALIHGNLKRNRIFAWSQNTVYEVYSLQWENSHCMMEKPGRHHPNQVIKVTSQGIKYMESYIYPDDALRRVHSILPQNV